MNRATLALDRILGRVAADVSLHASIRDSRPIRGDDGTAPAMTSPILANLLKLVDTPRDGALLRYSLGNEYLKAGDPAQAAVHLREAVARDPNHSASWKLLGKTLTEADALEEALAVYREGIKVAEQRGDRQGAKEMQVFARRLEKRLQSGEGGA